jgi:acyl-CoA synthetase (AMP-forming)/AMP-acid ligase II
MEYMEEKLEAYKVPKYFEAIDALPRTFNGKIDRKKLINGQK